MTTETTNPPAPPPAVPGPAPASVALPLPPRGVPLPCRPSVPPEDLKRLERELATYRRELPRLLAAGHSGRHALIREDQVVSIWDTPGDALQAARERFGLEPVTIATIDPRDPERFAALDATPEAAP